MDITVLIATGLCIIIAIVVLTFLKGRQSSKTDEGQAPPAEPVRAEPGARRRALAARNARARQRVAEQEEEEEDEQEAPVINLPEGSKIGAKKMAKLQAKAEKKAQRENEEKLRQEKKKAQELMEEERRKQEQKEQEEEKKRLEEEKKIREEKERQEYEEYLKLKETFSVQEEGFEENEESETLLEDFVNHIKKNKVVVLEDLAAEFKLKTQDAINRITNLQAVGQLTGVIDDRGKFIYISQEELNAIAKFVKQRGRVSISELVENSNNLVDLTPAA